MWLAIGFFCPFRYIVPIDSPGQVSRLTKEGFSHVVTMDKVSSFNVVVFGPREVSSVV